MMTSVVAEPMKWATRIIGIVGGWLLMAVARPLVWLVHR